MNRKFRSLVGGAAVAGLVMAGAVAASATDPIVLVTGLDGVESGSYTPEPGHWYAESNDSHQSVFFTDDGVAFGTNARAISVNLKTDEIPLGDLTGLGVDLAYDAVDATNPTTVQLVVKDETTGVTYMRLFWIPDSAGSHSALEDGQWGTTGYFRGGPPRVPLEETKSIADWLDGDVLSEDAVVTSMSVHKGSNSSMFPVVKSFSAQGTTYRFGTEAAAELAAYQASHPKTVDEARAGYVAQAELDAANAKVTELEAALNAAQDEVAALKAGNAGLVKDVAAAVKAKNTASNQALNARAQLPYNVTGKAKVGQTIRAKGAKFKGITVKYQWYVGGKKAGKKATLKLKKKHANKAVRVVVTKSYKNAAGKTVNVKTTARSTSASKVSR